MMMTSKITKPRFSTDRSVAAGRNPRLAEAGADLYATAFTTFRKVIWPLSLPGVVAGTLLTFIPAAGDFINSRLLGNTQTVMIGQVIESQFLRVLDYPLAAALSFIHCSRWAFTPGG